MKSSYLQPPTAVRRETPLSSELEPVLDRLASDLDRQVVLEGADFEVLAYSRKRGAIDQVRVDTILSRHAPAGVRSWLRNRGIGDADGPFRIDAAPRLGMLARVCLPIRAERELLGALWCIDSDGSITDEQLRAADALTPLLASILLREQQTATSARSLRQRALRRLLLGTDEQAAEAVDQLDREAVLDAAGPVSVHLLRSVNPSGDEPTADRATTAAEATDSGAHAGATPPRGITADRAATAGNGPMTDERALETALEQVRCGLRSRRCGYVVADGEGIFVCAEPAARQVSEQLLRAARATTGDATLIVAEGGHGRPDQARRLLAQARQAAQVSRVIERFRPVARWDELGVYQLLSSLTAAPDPVAPTAHRGLEALFTAGGRGSLVETLECYLDNGGDIKATASQLALHRTSLYYRLERIEQLAAVDVRSGEDRLALHLGLRLARLRGTYPVDGTVAA